MLRRLKELINSIDNHVDMLDDLNDMISKAIGSVRRKYGY